MKWCTAAFSLFLFHDFAKLFVYIRQDAKRAHHNALERKRRDHIKESFLSLRNAVPHLQNGRTGKPTSVWNSAIACKVNVFSFIGLLLTLWRQLLSYAAVKQVWASECPDVKNYKWWLNLVWRAGCFIAVHTWQQWASTFGLTYVNQRVDLYCDAVLWCCWSRRREYVWYIKFPFWQSWL